MELIRAANILIEKIKKDYKDDIAVVVIMGSYIYNATHSKSDLDMYYVPKTDRGYNLAKVFIMDGIGFDLWPISWERMQGIANHDERITSIITEGRVLYHGSEEDLERFNQLKAKALDVSNKDKFIKKSQEQLDKTYKMYFKLLKAESLSEARMHAMGIIFSVTYGLALLNRDTVKRGRGKLKEEIMSMPLVPKDFPTLYDTVFFSSDIEEIKTAYGQLIGNMEELILEEEAKEMKLDSFKNRLTGFYEELINFYNKIHHACEIGDSYTALFAAVEITHQIDEFFTGTEVSAKQLPDIVGAYDTKDTKSFLKVVDEHQLRLVELLQSKDVEICEFKNFEEFEKYMFTV